MDSQTFKITMFLGLALILALVVFLALGVTKDFAFAFGGKFGLKGTEDEKTFVTNPSDVTVELKCERNEEHLRSGQFLYKIDITNAKLQSEGEDDIRPVLYFKSRILKAKSGSKLNPEGIIPKEEVKTGNLGGLNFELETVSLPTYTKEFYTLFLFKKTDKCENAMAGAISEQVLVSQCSRALLAKFDAMTNSCRKDEIPYIKIDRIETRVEKGVNECRPVIKVINNDGNEWTAKDGYEVIIRNCETQQRELKDVQKASGIKDAFIPIWPVDSHITLPSGWTLDADSLNFVKDVFCKSGPEKKLELYENCYNDIFQKEKYCTNLYRPELFTEFVPKPVLIQSIPFTC